MSRLAWFWNDGKWGGLKGTNQSEYVTVREGANVAPFLELVLDDVIEGSGVFGSRASVGGGGGDHDGGNTGIESELEIMGKSGVEV